MNCQIEFANDDVGMPYGKTAVAKCSDCGTAIVPTVVWNAVGIPSAGYDYHVTHPCVRKPVQKQRLSLSRVDGSQSKQWKHVFRVRSVMLHELF
jgi:hypothetical protein